MPQASVGALSPDLMPLWRALHHRLGSGRAVASVKVPGMTSQQRTALADLFGMAVLPEESHTVNCRQLDAVLVELTGLTGREVAEQIVGPIEDRSAARAARASDRQALWAWLRAHPVVAAQPVLAGWVAASERAGLIEQSVERTRELLEKAVRVLRAIPAQGQPLPIFADETVGDPHALDEGTRLQGVVIRALSVIHDCPLPADAGELRRLWVSAGVADDELSSTVLVAGLGGLDPDGVLGKMLRVCADGGVAASVTLQQLRTVESFGSVPSVVHVVENPSVLAVAVRRFESHCPPLVCTAGWPNSAGIRLLDLLSRAGTRMKYHGDFDGEGLRIAAHLVARVGAQPWRMGSSDYLAAVSDGPGVGRVTGVPWDSALAGHLGRIGVSVPEERVVEILLADLVP
ncbi:TIGR02679 family protein [Nocardia sp. NPDC058480]|uniref:TIGR02679 family protein n=1 Tax=Nocardia sp. NPDC058480 TaxID=3346522 RepID=UPI003659A13A